uniref:Transmembrane protein n=1 Tax=Chromera velia CCMP2878 TaxID=1169474 RepID=A0A0G4F5A2_9ALVE|eukprot:Cvel_15238.t1-p1 / transcript=Cvel_15238.t1 / gene=Cvel_15238 / organism=Chromera_velia_CCMP2878 / gene_product=hypothetical protein / transcript_product=hypothetical protein / location=Cvel_scaffold1115:36550-39493(+) / protein_length=834 / sequence_SO=supercontig / SO=protein_coding / is_pseudo=false
MSAHLFASSADRHADAERAVAVGQTEKEGERRHLSASNSDRTSTFFSSSSPDPKTASEMGDAQRKSVTGQGGEGAVWGSAVAGGFKEGETTQVGVDISEGAGAFLKVGCDSFLVRFDRYGGFNVLTPAGIPSGAPEGGTGRTGDGKNKGGQSEEQAEVLRELARKLQKELGGVVDEKGEVGGIEGGKGEKETVLCIPPLLFSFPATAAEQKRRRRGLLGRLCRWLQSPLGLGVAFVGAAGAVLVVSLWSPDNSDRVRGQAEGVLADVRSMWGRGSVSVGVSPNTSETFAFGLLSGLSLPFLTASGRGVVGVLSRLWARCVGKKKKTDTTAETERPASCLGLASSFSLPPWAYLACSHFRQVLPVREHLRALEQQKARALSLQSALGAAEERVLALLDRTREAEGRAERVSAERAALLMAAKEARAAAAARAEEAMQAVRRLSDLEAAREKAAQEAGVLREKTEEMQSELTERKTALEERGREGERLRSQMTAFEVRLQTSEQSVASLQSRLKSAGETEAAARLACNRSEALVASLQKERQDLEAKAERLAASKGELQSEVLDLSARLRSLEEEDARRRASWLQAEARHEAVSREVTALQRELTEAQTARQQAEAGRQGAMRDVQKWEGALAAERERRTRSAADAAKANQERDGERRQAALLRRQVRRLESILQGAAGSLARAQMAVLQERDKRVDALRVLLSHGEKLGAEDLEALASSSLQNRGGKSGGRPRLLDEWLEAALGAEGKEGPLFSDELENADSVDKEAAKGDGMLETKKGAGRFFFGRVLPLSLLLCSFGVSAAFLALRTDHGAAASEKIRDGFRAFSTMLAPQKV